MSWPASQVDAYFLAEDDGALEARERYNFSRAQQKDMEAAKGFERLAVSMHRYSTSQAPIIAQARKSRRIILLMPTIAGTAEIVYTELFQTARSAQLWDICRDALNDHRFVEMAREMGLQRPKHNMIDTLRPMLDVGKSPTRPQVAAVVEETPSAADTPHRQPSSNASSFRLLASACLPASPAVNTVETDDLSA